MTTGPFPLAREALDIWCYTLPPGGAGGQIARQYAPQFTTLELTTAAPGGCGDFTGKLLLPDARLPRPELATFSRLAVMDPSMPSPAQCVWNGEISDPELGMTTNEGEYILLRALGLGATLRDDPRTITYSGKTPQQIVKQEMSDRAAYLVIDADTSQVFPDNPTTTYSPAYIGRNMEDVVGDIAGLAGDYMWGTWPHPLNKDAAGFPTGQLSVKLRDAATIAYTAYDSDITGWRITPSQNRAYNVITIYYYDLTQTTPVSFVQYKDSRLAANGSQGTAPFRRRNYLRDLGGVSTASAANAQTLANTQGAIYQNLTNTVEITLSGLRDANGNPIPLWQAWSDRNIFVPSLAVRGTQLATVPTAGVNLFYIRATRYTEDQAGTQQLVLTCDNFADLAAIQLARLQLMADLDARTGSKSVAALQALGGPVKGVVGGQFNPTANNVTNAIDVSYGTVLAQVPTSITLSATSSSNASNPTASNLGVYGFTFAWTAPSSASPSAWHGTYVTNGNCLLDVDEARGTFAHHCDGCGVVRRGLRLARDLVVRRDLHPARGAEPGLAALSYTCPTCGSVEAFNTNLGPEDEEDGRRHDADRVRLIRRVMRHPHVGLPTRAAPLAATPPERAP